MNGSLSVVVIDDDPGDAALVRHMLSSVRPPIAMTSATTLEEGMACIEVNRPDAVLLDLGLPSGEGSETFEQFHRHHPELATIVLTGLDDPSLQLKLVSDGAQDYLVKGQFDAARLTTTIRHAVERQRLVEERRAASTELSRSEQRFRVLAEVAQDVIYRVFPDGTFEYVSPSCEPVLGVHPDALYADPEAFWSRTDADYRIRARNWPALVPTSARTFTGSWFHPDGRELWLEDVRTPLVEDGRIVAIQGVIRDGSATRQQQRALQEALDREQAAADRLRALNEMKSTFLSAVSHELRTPLTTILGFAATLATRDVELAPELRSAMLDRLLSNAHKLSRLVDDLLDLDRLSRGVTSLHVTGTEMVGLATRTVEQVEGSAGRVTVEGDAELWAEVDASKLERIVENLVANSLRHTPAESRVRVTVEGRDGGVTIVVEDDGPGVPAELKHRIFKPFQQGHEAATSASPGAGIGLALVERFTHCHGGRVTVEDRPGGGARFVVWLPQRGGNGEPPPVPLISQHVRTEVLERLKEPSPLRSSKPRMALRRQRAW